jgi:hypothetical protein
MNYKKIHDSIINNAKLQNRSKKENTYYEAHHITPKCLGGEGKYTDWSWHDNIVLLTPKEHYLIHRLLIEIYTKNTKLVYAFWRICNTKNNKIISPRAYEYSRLEFIKKIKNHKFNLGRKLSINHKELISKKLKGKKKREGFGKKISDANKGKLKSESHRINISKSKKGKKSKYECKHKKTIIVVNSGEVIKSTIDASIKYNVSRKTIRNWINKGHILSWG